MAFTRSTHSKGNGIIASETQIMRITAVQIINEGTEIEVTFQDDRGEYGRINALYKERFVSSFLFELGEHYLDMTDIDE